ncbi:energy-coupling factor ABC transporter transmembrane protein [Metakosakonia massiliensis]|uniref:Cobalt transport protein CbiQ n=1 Tax=Phytobacter massiliensis TaxID=1485952 RepID=A0A6N3HH22_9ENTR
MQAIGLDRLSYQSRWYNVAPERKFLFWLAMMALAFSLPPLGQGALLVVLALFTCWLLRMSFWRWLRWMAIPLAFLLVGVVTIVFSVTREPQQLLAGIPLGGYWLGVTAQGLSMANDTVWRSLAALAATFWLVLNLPFPQLIILLRKGRVPRLLTEQILLTWRFIFILLEEAMAIHRAQTLRFGYRTLPLSYRSLAMLVGLLFTRVLLRYKEMATTLEIKLYQGDFHL